MTAEPGDGALERDFERFAAISDDTAAREMLALGMPVHVVRDGTPAGHVVRVFSDGREQIIAVDREAAARILGP